MLQKDSVKVFDIRSFDRKRERPLRDMDFFLPKSELEELLSESKQEELLFRVETNS